MSESAAEKLIEDTSQTVEEISLPVETILDVQKDLVNSALFIPPTPRKFKDWDVGLLERFEDLD